jgi:transcriptional regulator with XRE-family HTH domain
MVDQSETAREMPLGEKRKLLRDFREHADMTLTALGKRAKLSHPMLSQFETGERDLSEESWDRVLDVMQEVLLAKQVQMDAGLAKAKEIAAKLGARDPGAEALAEAIEGSIGGSFGQFLGDTFAPSRPGAFERYRTMTADFQRRFGTDGPRVLVELAEAQAEAKKLREFIGRLQAELTQSHMESATLKEWLDAEMVAAIAQEKALELRTRVHEEEGRQMRAPEQQAEKALSVRLYESVLSGRPITDEEHKQARALSLKAKKLKAD